MAQFRSFWFGDDLPPYQRLAAKSFIDFGHDYDLYAYTALDAPKGVVVRDANEILPRARVFVYGEHVGAGRGSVAAFANLFRSHVLYRMGGWWVDADVVCLSDTVPASDIFMGWEHEDVIGNAILKFPARHELAHALRDACEKAGPNVKWGATGPTLLTRLITQAGLLHLVALQSLAYPVRSVDALQLLMPERRGELEEKIANRPFLHLWNEIFRRAVVFPWMAPPAGSLLAVLCARHGIGFDHAHAYTEDQIQRLSENYDAAAAWSHPQAEADELARLSAQLEAALAEGEALSDEVARLRTRLRATQRRA